MRCGIRSCRPWPARTSDPGLDLTSVLVKDGRLGDASERVADAARHCLIHTFDRHQVIERCPLHLCQTTEVFGDVVGNVGVESLHAAQESQALRGDFLGEVVVVAGATIPDTGSNCEPGSYTIEDGDNARSKVANKFDVTVEALDAANVGTNGYSAFYPGLKIVIPAKADC